jgi:hypothetical protein
MMYGTHPVTSEPYSHHGKAPHEIGPKDLPTVTRGQIAAFAREIAGIASACRNAQGEDKQTSLTVLEAFRGVEEGGRHEAMKKVAASCRGRGWSRDQAKKAVTEAARRCTPPYSAREATKLVEWSYDTYPAPATKGGMPGDARRPCKANRRPDPSILPILTAATHRAKRRLYPTKGSKRYRRFLSIIQMMDTLMDGQPIPLPQPAIASRLGCKQQAVSKYIRQALDSDLLMIVDPYYQPGILAKTYRFLGEH